MNNPSLPAIVVVGAAGGIGQKVVLQLQSRARVIAVVQNAAQRAEVNGKTALCLECDLGDGDAVQRTLDLLAQLWREPIHGVICCAAMQPIGPLELMSRADIERLFAINVFGSLQFLKGVMGPLRRTRGNIVLFSSMAGRVAPPVLGAYAASKFALEAFADALRRELRPAGVQVSLIEPGGVKTPMAAAQGPLVQRMLTGLDVTALNLYGSMIRGYGSMAAAALRHASEPEDVAAVAVDAVFAKRPRARYLVGLDAKLTVLLAKLLPVSWLDRLLVSVTLKG